MRPDSRHDVEIGRGSRLDTLTLQQHSCGLCYHGNIIDQMWHGRDTIKSSRETYILGG